MICEILTLPIVKIGNCSFYFKVVTRFMIHLTKLALNHAIFNNFQENILHIHQLSKQILSKDSICFNRIVIALVQCIGIIFWELGWTLHNINWSCEFSKDWGNIWNIMLCDFIVKSWVKSIYHIFEFCIDTINVICTLMSRQTNFFNEKIDKNCLTLLFTKDYPLFSC